MQLYSRALAAGREKIDPDEVFFLDMEIAMAHLKSGDVKSAKTLLENYEDRVATMKPAEAIVFSKYYQALADYKKIIGPANEFYSASLKFLSYTSIDDMLIEDKMTLAKDIALAALSGEDIYNFGEVLATPILNCLVSSPIQWLKDLVEVINGGNITGFNKIVQAHSQEYLAEPIISTSQEIIKQKAILLSLVNLAFERPSHSRIIDFVEISDKCLIPLQQVEWVLMKAMAIGLIKGVIDEVVGHVLVSWVQPRVLDKVQLAAINDQLAVWSEK